MKEEITYFHINDNSDALRSWLDTKAVPYIRNGNFTSINIMEDIFNLGKEYGIYYRENHPKYKTND